MQAGLFGLLYIKRSKMRKLIKRKSAPEPADSVLPQAKTDLIGCVNKIQEQLAALEKKVDTLIALSSSGQRFGRPNRFKGARRDEGLRGRNFTKAVCADCGKECELPFRPSGDRPVYCRDCFAARKESGGERSFDNRTEVRGEESGKKKSPFFRRRR
jgi:CxxC-x17-CxxC domain-containing protein